MDDPTAELPPSYDSGVSGRPGPLSGLSVVELAGIGPAPYAATLLADLGADVVRVDRPSGSTSAVDPTKDPLRRSRRSIAIDLRDPDGIAVVEQLVGRADILLEGFRPGVTERLGLGPDRCLEINPRLVYGRITGWGNKGPLAHTAGHDITYIAITGALDAIGRPGERPVPPANFVGDFGGGSTFLVIGILAAVIEAQQSGRGQVVDAAIVDGASSLTAILHGLIASGRWREDQRGDNMLDGGFPWYDTYGTSDGKYVAVGALEHEFYAQLLDRLGLDPREYGDRSDRAKWSALRRALADAFRTRTRDEWSKLFSEGDACVAPVLSLTEAATHPHLAARRTFVDVAGMTQPAPAPRFSRTSPEDPEPAVAPGANTREILEELAVSGIDNLLARGAVTQHGETVRGASERFPASSSSTPRAAGKGSAHV